MKLLPSALVLLAAASAWAPPVRGAEAYDNCTGFITSLPAVISTQGTWCMDRDLSTGVASGNAITLTTNNVVVDCNGFKLGNLAAGPDTQAAGIVSTDRLNHTVRNCNVRGFRYGILLTTTATVGGGHLVEDSRVEASRAFGIAVSGQGGTVRRNVVVDTGDGPGAAHTQATGISVAYGVDVLDNLVDGVFQYRPGDYVVVVGIQSGNNGGTRIERNAVRGLASDIEGVPLSLIGILVVDSLFSSIVDNRVTSHGIKGTTGILCSGGGRARDNMVAGHAGGIAYCGDAGGNDVVQ